MKDLRQPTKIIVILSDGYPHAQGYGGLPAQRHVRTVVDWADRLGIHVVQIAIDSELRPEDQGRMFRDWLPYSTDARLPRDLTRLLARLV